MATAKKLNKTLTKFIERQHLFFVATAARDGRVNLSPKGMDTLRVINETEICWLNLSGSGNETAAHVQDINRMTLMFCAFEGDALILRTYGQVETLHPRDEGWGGAASLFPELAGSRQIFKLTVDLVQTSCGTGVPFMNFAGQRGPEELVPYYDEMGPDGVRDYWARKNVFSIDEKPTGIFKDESAKD